MTLDYEKLIEAYHKNLNETLRNFSSGERFLATWVPDEDVTISCIDLVEAASLGGYLGSLTLVIGPAKSKNFDFNRLQREVSSFAKVDLIKSQPTIKLQFKLSKKLSPIKKLRLKDSSTHSTSSDTVKARGISFDLHPEIEKTLLKLPPQKPKPKFNGPTTTHQTHDEELGFEVDLDSEKQIKGIRISGLKPKASRLGEALNHALFGLPINEAAHHGVLHFLDELQGKSPNPFVSGILTPKNAGTLVERIQRMLRTIRSKVVQPSELRSLHSWSPSRSTTWGELSLKEKKQQVQSLLDRLCQREGIQKSKLSLFDIQNQSKVFLEVQQDGSDPKIHEYLLSFERELREKLEPNLELFYKAFRDRNQNRQQSTSPPVTRQAQLEEPSA